MELASTVVGVLANIITICSFLCEIPTFNGMVKARDTRERGVSPLLAVLFSCACWVLYGSPWVRSLMLVVTSNGIPFAIESAYLGIVMYYATPQRWKKVVLGIGIAACGWVVVVLMSLQMVRTDEGRATMLGISCVMVNSCTYVRPVYIMVETVIVSHSTERMSPLCVFLETLSRLLWIVYGTLVRDVWITMANGFGGLLGICEGVVYLTYRGETRGKQAQVASVATVVADV